MSNILPSGSVNPNALTAPGAYIINQLPTPPITGISTGTILVVGTATWGAVNTPVSIGSITQQINTFGSPQNSTYDMGTQVYAANSVGASSFLGVRVTDGTDVKAFIEVKDVTTPTPVTGMTLTAKHSGTLGNSLKVVIEEGTNSTIAAPTFKVTILFPAASGNTLPETFDNIGGTGLALWQAIVDAINLGQGSLTAPSELVSATIGTATDEPDLTTYTLAGGTNGNSGVTATTLIGSNTASPKTGMYAAISKLFNFMVLSGVTDSSTYAAQALYAEEAGAYAMLDRPIGESIADGIVAKKAVALYTYSTKLIVGQSWVKIQDSFNNVQRYIPTAGLVAGRLATLDVQDSGLNKQIQSSILVSTWFADQNRIYNNAEVSQLLVNGLDAIGIRQSLGNYWSLLTGKNTSDNLLIENDNYPKLYNFIALSIQPELKDYVGALNNPSVLLLIKNKLDVFLTSLAVQNIIGSSVKKTPQPPAFSVVVTSDENQALKGIVDVSIKVAFFGIIQTLLVNLEGGLSFVPSNGGVVPE